MRIKPAIFKYCPSCDKITIFRYNNALAHSTCNDCGKTSYVPRMEYKAHQAFKQKIRDAWEVFDNNAWQIANANQIDHYKPVWLQREQGVEA